MAISEDFSWPPAVDLSLPPVDIFSWPWKDVAGLTFATRMVARTLFETLILTIYLAFFPDRAYDLVRSNFGAQV
jgi:hypothetical protein